MEALPGLVLLRYRTSQRQRRHAGRLRDEIDRGRNLGDVVERPWLERALGVRQALARHAREGLAWHLDTGDRGLKLDDDATVQIAPRQRRVGAVCLDRE